MGRAASVADEDYGLPEARLPFCSSQAAFTLNRIVRQVVELPGFDRLKYVFVCEAWQTAAELNKKQ
jgi:hypothetical protein